MRRRRGADPKKMLDEIIGDLEDAASAVQAAVSNLETLDESLPGGEQTDVDRLAWLVVDNCHASHNAGRANFCPHEACRIAADLVDLPALA